MMGMTRSMPETLCVPVLSGLRQTEVWAHNRAKRTDMTNDEMQHSIEAPDRQLDAIVKLLASLAERLSELLRVTEIQNTRITRLEGTQS
jgi:hypothetical protein